MESHAATKAPDAKTLGSRVGAGGALCRRINLGRNAAFLESGVSWRHDEHDAFGVKKTYLVGGIPTPLKNISQLG